MILELGMEGERNKAIFRSLCRDDILQAMQEEDRDLLRRLLQSRLPGQLHSEIRTVLDELF
jgi:hypothetical protein